MTNWIYTTVVTLALAVPSMAAKLELPINLKRIETFIKDNKITSMSQFLESLPEEFRKNWLYMNNSESPQPSPRIILQGDDGKALLAFSLARDEGGKYMENSLELIEWDDTEKRFMFRKIEFGSEGVSYDPNPSECFGCHKGRPNWDPYDNWANLLPFNRDRLYEGSTEAIAFKRFAEVYGDDPRWKSLVLPPGVTVTRDKKGKLQVNLEFKQTDPKTTTKFKGKKYTQGGNYLRFSHSDKPTSDEGRGVRLFDDLTRLNSQRVAQQILNSPNFDRFKYALLGILSLGARRPKGKEGRDGDIEEIEEISEAELGSTKGEAIIEEEVDPFEKEEKPGPPKNSLEKQLEALLKKDLSALEIEEPKEINSECLNTSKEFESFIPKKILREREKESGKTLRGYIDDTLAQQKKLPAEKIKLQRETFREMILEQAKRAGLTLSKEEIEEKINQEMLRRNFAGFKNYKGAIVDREAYQFSSLIGRLRYLLEPEGIDVSTWSLSVKDRSKTFTFADQFIEYAQEIRTAVEENIQKEKKKTDCLSLEGYSFKAYQKKRIARVPGDPQGNSRTH